MIRKTHHNPDYAKDKTADVIKKGNGRAVPNEYWEKNMDLTPEGDETPEGVWRPRRAKNRPTSYPKTNECDH
jgi:hypothetical protein